MPAESSGGGEGFGTGLSESGGKSDEADTLERNVSRRNSQLERANSQLKRAKSQLDRGDPQMERANSQRERANSQLEMANLHLERETSQLERETSQLKRANIPENIESVRLAGVEERESGDGALQIGPAGCQEDADGVVLPDGDQEASKLRSCQCLFV
jgi:chromosome segregation ATPase